MRTRDFQVRTLPDRSGMDMYLKTKRPGLIEKKSIREFSGMYRRHSLPAFGVPKLTGLFEVSSVKFYPD